MHTKNQIWRILVTLALAAGLISPLGHAAQASDATRNLHDPISITLDGARDAGYIPLASDPSGDLGDPGGQPSTQWSDLTELYVAADATYLYVYADLPGYTQAGSTGSILLALDVDGDPLSGGTQDPWLNDITFDYAAVDGAAALNTLLPDYVVRGHIVGNDPDPNKDNGWTELLNWDGSAWQGFGTNWGGITAPGQVGTHIAYSDNNGIEFAIPLADIGSPQLAEVHLQLITTQADINKGAYDTIPSDDQSAGWNEPTTQTQLVSMPVAVDPSGDLDPSGPGSFNGTAWSDMTRLHLWADHASLHLYIPMADYNSSLSEGSFLLAINTTTGGGNTGDPWGNAITFDFDTIWQNLGATPQAAAAAPDYVIRGNIFGAGGNGWTELRTWNGSNFDTGGGTDWGGIGNSGEPSLPGSKVAWSNGDGLRITISFSDIGVSAGDQVDLQFLSTQTENTKGAYDTVPTDDQTAGGWNDPTTQSIMASYIIPTIEMPGASHDNNVWWAELGHDSRDTQYRTPGGPVPTGTIVTLRLRAAKNDLTAAQVRLWNDRIDAQSILNMTLVATDATYEYWEVTLPPSADPTVYWYRFIAIDGTDTDYYADDAQRLGGWGEASDEEIDNSWQLTIYDPTFQTPGWLKNAVVYQIFPDRFYDGDETNDTQPGTFFYDETGTIYRSDPDFGTDNPWNTYICDPRDTNDCPGTYSKNFYGGDLAGLTAKLPYLADLGITAIYLNPIFESPSNHKYDATDYSIVDDNFGTLADFEALVDAADALGIVLILDGVFNHVSSDSIYFDRYGRYPEVGACESNLSPYRDWFYFQPEVDGPCMGDDGTPNAATYTSWWGYDSLPKLDASNQEVRDLIWASGATAIGPYWMDGGSDNSRAMGWRLDVAGDVDPGTLSDPTNDYWEGFRAATHAVNPDTYIVGEEWGNSASWTLGGEWDASMNYPFGTAIMGFWRDEAFEDNDHNTGSSAGLIEPLMPSQLNERLLNLQERYAPEAFYAMMNLLGSHDTNRALFMMDHRTDEHDDSIYLDPAYDWTDAIERLQGVAILQFTLPGAPTIYYGDEVGLVGPVAYANDKWEDDPYNRQPYPWLEVGLGDPYYEHLQSEAGQDVLRDWYTLLIGIRNDHPALRTGTFDPLLVDDPNMIYAYGRKLLSENDAAVVVLNRQPDDQAVVLDLSGYLPVGAGLLDVLNGNPTPYIVAGDGSLTLPAVPGMSGMVLVLDSGSLTPPDAPADLIAIESESQVDLEWGDVPGAAYYKVYRSQVSGGGYVYQGNVAISAYVDTDVVNGTQYYYVVTTVDANGLESVYSNEADALPHWDIDLGYLSLPTEITHTVGITPTEDIFGRVQINGVTTATGQTEGLRAQVGFGDVSAAPDSWADWVEADFHMDVLTYDEFAGALTPELTGEYAYVYRFSTTNGRDWYYGDLNGEFDGSGISPNPGRLHVVPSDDTTAPTTPQNLVVVDTAAAFVQLAWDPITGDPTLYAYDLFRSDADGYTGELLARVLAPASGYVDWSVTTGETYYYYVQAVDRSFNRSGFSNEVDATPTARPVTVTFNVTVPAGTPGTVYIAGNAEAQFGGFWNPGGQPLNPSGTPDLWTISLDFMEGDSLEFKFARGSWDMVEKQADGKTEVANRKLTVEYLPSGRAQVVDLVVENWRDPFVVGIYPSAGATDVFTDTVIEVTWNQSMTVGTDFSVMGPAGPVSGTFAYDDPTWTVTFTPAEPLRSGTTYTVIVEGQIDIHGDLQFAATQWSFTTAGPRILLLPMIQRH